MGRKQQATLRALVDDLVAHVQKVLAEELNVDAEHGRLLGLEVSRRLCEQYGKTYMYVPSALPFQLAERDQAIWHAYLTPGPDGARACTRDRVDQIAAEHKLSPQHVYVIVKLAHAMKLEQVQPTLDGFEMKAGTTSSRSTTR